MPRSKSRKLQNRGYDRDWYALRAKLLPGKRCVAPGCGKAAAELDHIVSIREDPGRRLDPTNLRPLCKRCHSRRTAREQIHKGRTQYELTACDATGYPTDPRHPWNRHHGDGE